MIDQIPALLAGDRRVLARMITYIENDGEEKEDLLRELHHHTGKGYVIGITGSPGAGKSSLTDRVITELRKEGHKVGVIAVDPTSPFSGGAILGDRIRMNEHYLDKGVFIRSMGTRGSLGGLSRATKEVIKVLDAFGCDFIIVETVGVGQSELEIMTAADTTVVVLTPGAGDSIQAIKAGIMEIADIFVVNKADLPGVDRVVTEIEVMLDLGGYKKGDQAWRPPVKKTVSTSGTGVDILVKEIKVHRQQMEKTGRLDLERQRRLRAEVSEIIEVRIKEMIRDQLGRSGQWDELLEGVISRTVDPYTAAHKILKEELWKRSEP
ncbi:methylmalonyl Co-A mutase-associated GTPase MeaB [Heliorestis acidaminivorans]|uniref:Methylmalonyl Co-A mutase-associated GTPase MeaB n=1 Tax=Heliorestis acidaminivorans TaxID=553427 RepID=A0A6I0ERS4_9FIRM|nr:methylmalonyl Co-A mutase-associated GTPase MeaB [Heliorestis acidaminivorans]KAB2952353.1 methylmalonyl Co-A mutase-associated GTPase MeaB [Heliorestis acidaminivorans]